MNFCDIKEDFEEEIARGIPLCNNNEKGIPFLPHPCHSFKKGESGIHVLLPSLQSVCTGDQLKQRVNYRNLNKKLRK